MTALFWIYLAGFALWYSAGLWLMGINEHGLIKAMLVGILMGSAWPFMLSACFGIMVFEGVAGSAEFFIEILWTGGHG